jgi:dihydropyrimidinase
MHHGSDYTPYEGFEVTGWPVLTMARGVTVFENGKPVGKKDFGQFVARQSAGKI